MTEDPRAIMRATQELFLRSALLLAQQFDNDFTRALIWLAIDCASTGFVMDDPQLGPDLARRGEGVPDVLRRPISRLAVAQSLGIPYETCRRHITRLLDDGWCVEVDGRGVMVPAARMAGPAMNAVRDANAANVRRFLKRLSCAEGHAA
ncbi:hypothetical protein ACO2Q3_26210 [Caulobacter sp. KR2-114]|uniref:hypothetical protein n=1 Tax=Caulobacter sp. KR2-114 TaxID=3400912 RepID=UPI003C0C9E41